MADKEKKKQEPDLFDSAWEWGNPEAPVFEQPIEIKSVPKKIAEIFAAHTTWTDSLVSQFGTRLEAIVGRAIERLTEWLKSSLSLDGDEIEATPENLAVLRSLDAKLMEILYEEGYGDLLKWYTGQFPGQIKYLTEIADATARLAGHTTPAFSFSPSDLDLFKGLEASSIKSLEVSMEAAVGSAVQKVLFSVNALPFGDLVETFREAFGGSVGTNTTRAMTSSTVYYRVATDQSFKIIEATTGRTIRYVYYGPDDLKTRVFCRMMLARTAKEPMTRAEIDELDNGQTGKGSVWQYCGGYNCRHQILMDLSEIETERATLLPRSSLAKCFSQQRSDRLIAAALWYL